MVFRSVFGIKYMRLFTYFVCGKTKLVVNRDLEDRIGMFDPYDRRAP